MRVIMVVKVLVLRSCGRCGVMQVDGVLGL